MNLTGVAVAEVNRSPFRAVSRLPNLAIESTTRNLPVAYEGAA
jgi:hypothetical protein